MIESKKLISGQLETIAKISEHINSLQTNVYKMIAEREKANKIDDVYKHAIAYCEKVKPYFDNTLSYWRAWINHWRW